jgi:hypothetical protein
MKILIIEQNCLWSDFQRENRERFWIKELRVLHPGGINRKQYSLFCKVTPVSIQAFVEGLLRLANVLKATNGTLKNVNNICTLAINDLCSPPFINDYPYHSQMRHTLPGDNYTILSLQ